MGQTTKAIATLIASALLSSNASAQTPSPSPSAPAGTIVPPPTPLDRAPEIPNVDDPMLVPVGPAANTLGSWRDALRLVRQRSTALHIAEAGVEQQRGLARSALARALPTVTAGSTLTRYILTGTGYRVPSLAYGSIPTPATQLGASLGLVQPIVDFGAWYGVGTAKEREHVAELSQADTQRQLLGIVAQAVVGVVTATRVSESSRVSLMSALSTRDLTKKRFELGAASAVDALRAEQEVALTRAQIVTADEQLRLARESLGAALGDTQGWGVAADIHLEELRETAAQICTLVDGVDTRSDILAAKGSVNAAERDRKAIDYTYLPTLDLTSTLSYTNTVSFSPNGEHVNWTVAGQLSWLLYDGGDRYGQKRTTSANLTIAKEQLTQKKRDATLQVTQADRSILVAQANLQVASATRDLAKESARLARIAFVNGTGTSFDLVDNSRKLREAEIDLLIRDFRVFQARLTAFLARANCTI